MSRRLASHLTRFSAAVLIVILLSHSGCVSPSGAPAPGRSRSTAAPAGTPTTLPVLEVLRALGEAQAAATRAAATSVALGTIVATPSPAPPTKTAPAAANATPTAPAALAEATQAPVAALGTATPPALLPTAEAPLAPTALAGTVASTPPAASTPVSSTEPGPMPVPTWPSVAAPRPVADITPLLDELRTELFGSGPISPEGGGALMGVYSLPMAVPANSLPLWAVYTSGLPLAPERHNNFVSIYTRTRGGTWDELAKLELACPSALDAKSVRQVRIVPEKYWLEIKGDVGAHSGCYDLVSFDGHLLQDEVSYSNSFPWPGWLADLDGDRTPEVVLDKTDHYVFCYACGEAFLDYEVRRWGGGEYAQVELANLPKSSPAALRTANNDAVGFAQAGLWRDALDAISGTLKTGTQNPTVLWNNLLIGLTGGARAQHAQSGPYPLLGNIFYGDFEAALSLMRPFSPEQLFNTAGPLIAGTVAEGWERELSRWVIQSTSEWLQLRPDLSEGYFLRGWAEILADPASTDGRSDVARAAQLAPDDELFAASQAYLSK